MNNPSRFTDPSGHISVEGDGGNLTQAQAEYDRQRLDALTCQSGNKDYCSYGENHPVETAVTIGGGLLLAGAGMAAIGATTLTEITTAGSAATTIETACGPDGCGNEAQEVGQAVQGAEQVLNDLMSRSEEVRKGLYRSPGGLSDAVDILGKTLKLPVVREKVVDGGSVFIGATKLGGEVTFRAWSSLPSTPVLQFKNVSGFLASLKFHFP